MKKWLVFFEIFALGFVLMLATTPVVAEEGWCNWVDTLKGLSTTSGAEVTAKKDDPPYPVVVWQDPERYGVQITVTVNSQPGSISYDKPVRDPECNHYDAFQPGRSKDECDARTSEDFWKYGYDGFYYTDLVWRCQLVTRDNVYRQIKAVRIWLEPSDKTRQWLGWKPFTDTGKFALRYIFPDSWTAGYWTTEGPETIPAGNVGYTVPIDDFMDKYKDLDFLAGTTLATKEFKTDLPLVKNPMAVDIGNLVIGLFGDFSGWNFGGYEPSWAMSNACVEMWNRKADCNAAVSTNDNPTSVVISMKKIPLDLPGKWSIGVMIEMAAATFYDDTRGLVTEPTGWDGGKQWFYPTDINVFKYLLMKNTFNSYVILTAPCNPYEPKGCWDDSY